MKKTTILILSIILLIGCSADTISQVQPKDRGLNIKKKPKEAKKTEQRVALIIGNNNYKGVLSKLSNPINDANSIKNILEKSGFQVIYTQNSTKRSTKKNLDKFYNALKKGGVGMFYFSGHGIEVDGQNYLIPTDAKIKEKSDTEFEAISLNKITKRMQNIGNRLNIVVLDACRNDPFSRAIGVGGLAKTEPIGMFVSFSTGAGSVASDGKSGENGLFTKALIKYMQQDLELKEVFNKTRAEVYEQSNHKQFPAIYDQTINGKFYFTHSSSQKTPTATPIVTTKRTSPQTPIQKNRATSLQTIAYSPKLSILNPSVKKRVTITTSDSRITNDLIEIVLNIKNNTNQKTDIKYKVKWMNNEGYPVGENLSIWQPLFIEADDLIKIKETAPMPTASSCTVYFK